MLQIKETIAVILHCKIFQNYNNLLSFFKIYIFFISLLYYRAFILAEKAVRPKSFSFVYNRFINTCMLILNTG